jgi:hypothetical protein
MLLLCTRKCARPVLLVEAFNKKEETPFAKQTWQDYRRFVNGQETFFVSDFDVFSASELSKWRTFPSDPRLDRFHFLTIAAIDARQSYYAGSAYGWQQPTVLHQQAEALLAHAQSMGPDERRIVVWMVYPQDYQYGAPPKPVANFDEVNILITSVDRSPAEDVEPIRIDILPAPTNPAHTIKRFIFSPKLDGVYVLKNMNGTTGLPDITGYKGNPVYFQHPTYLDFKMTVSSNKQFAFTEFAPYSDLYPTMTWGSNNLPQ